MARRTIVTRDSIPDLTGPVVMGRHGRPFASYLGDLTTDFEYVEEEYFLSGEAVRFIPLTEPTVDGKWDVRVDGAAPYTTRILVRRPLDPARFNGTVVLEWMNVTAGYEIATMGGVSSGVYESGYVFATASCQQIGLNGFSNGPQGLRQWDPQRYGSLSIPGDAYAYDIFSQIGRALGPQTARDGADPLHGLTPRQIIAIGASQSAIRLRTYANAVQPRERVFDGIVTMLDFGTAMGFDDWVYDPTVLSPGDTGRLFTTHARIRDDLTTPVFVVNSEFETLRYLPSRQADSDRFRFWEIAGASHVAAPDARRQAQVRERDGLVADRNTSLGSEVMWQPTADAAIDHMRRWSADGALPPVQPLVEVTPKQPNIARDSYGNARGGVRLPELEAPIASYTGVGPGAALLSGTTTPFPRTLLTKLYPTQGIYAEAVAEAARAAQSSGVITAHRAQVYIEQARSATF